MGGRMGGGGREGGLLRTRACAHAGSQPPHPPHPPTHPHTPQSLLGEGAAAVRIEQPEVEDESLGDTFKTRGNEFFAAGDYKGAAELYGLALSHWVK